MIRGGEGMLDPSTCGHGATVGRIAAWAVLLCASAAPAVHAQPLNERCPVMTEEPVDPAITVVYQGKPVAFCCDTCLEKFKANPDKYLARLPQFAAAAADGAANGPATEKHSAVPWSGRVHPAVVHFPLVGIPLALLGYLLWLITGQQSFARADVVPLAVGTLGAVTAVLTGGVAHDHMRFSETLHEIVERHEFCSTTAMILALALSALRAWRWKRLSGGWRWVYLSGLGVATILLAVTGYLGGSLVFGPDHLAWS